MATPDKASVQIARLSRPQRRLGFTLVELLVAMTVLLVMALMMVALANQTNNIWRSSRTRIEAFQGARNAFDRLTTNLNQATLNTYLDYYNSTNVNAQSRSDLLRAAEASGNNNNNTEALLQNFIPQAYDRASELQFVCGPSQDGTQEGNIGPPLLPNTSVTRPTHAIFFACPVGHVSDPQTSGTTATNDFKTLDRVLNAIGYYVEFNNSSDRTKMNLIPQFITTVLSSWRYRLMELNQPSQNLAVYSASTFNPHAWFSLAVDPLTGPPPYPPVIIAAENIVALIIHPKATNPTQQNPYPTDIAPYYGFDSKGYAGTTTPSNAVTAKNQLPPLVQVTLVAIDSDSATRLAAQFGTTAPPLVKSGAFTAVSSSSTTNDGKQYTADLSALESKLQSYHVNYRVFVTDVSVPGAKWSQTETY